MCGIAGIIHLDGAPASQPVLKNMTDAIAHRGPNGEGHWLEENIGIGHRRLSIVDLSPAAHQPMISSDHRYVLSYNGEVYNFLKLRAELEACGYLFRSRTDTEVVLYALIEWGVKALNKFNGMFGFAFWDRKTKTMLLARDRYGIKPLYYGYQNEIFVFASEQKAILKIPSFKTALNKKALLQYFTFQNIFTDDTLSEGIQLLSAGYYGQLDITKKEGKLQLTQYWDFNFHPSNTDKVTEAEYQEELDRLFHQAVNRQLISDVELGSYLSGGMDSGSITAIAAKSYPFIKTFTCGFDLNSASGLELGFDERAKAEHMSYFFKTEHYEMVLKAGDMERCLPKLAYHIEEPRIGQSYPNFYAAQLASKFVKVVLGGIGGDELFAGYPWRYYRAAVNSNFNDYIHKYYQFWQRLISNTEIKQLFAPILNEVKDIWTKDIFKGIFCNHTDNIETPEDYINYSLYFEAKTFLHGLLVVEDKLSMAHGLETRMPFLDNDLVDFAMKCAVSLKLNRLNEVFRINENIQGNKQRLFFQKTKDGKQILRKVMKKYIPDSVCHAIKQGFSAPDASWFKGESIEFVKQKLLNKNANIYRYFNPEIAQRLINEHLSGKKNRRLFIWSLLSFEEWCSVYG